MRYTHSHELTYIPALVHTHTHIHRETEDKITDMVKHPGHSIKGAIIVISSIVTLPNPSPPEQTIMEFRVLLNKPQLV